MNLAIIWNALLFVSIGIVLFPIALFAVTRVLPGNLWEEAIKQRNMGAAAIVAAIALAVGWIVAAAVH